MSLPEKPRKLPSQYDAKAVEQVIQDIYTALNNGLRHVQFQVNYTAPERTKTGMVLFADGTEFDPSNGYGAGLYRRSLANGGWIKLLDHQRPLMRNPKFNGMYFYYQPTRITVATASATLTGADLLVGLIQYTSTGGNLTTDTATLIDAAITSSTGAELPAEYEFPFSIINTGSGTATVVTGTDVNSVGSLAVSAGTSALFGCRKRATNLYTINRLA